MWERVDSLETFDKGKIRVMSSMGLFGIIFDVQWWFAGKNYSLIFLVIFEVR